MATRKQFGKPHAGTPHAQIDADAAALAKPGQGHYLCKTFAFALCLTAPVIAAAEPTVTLGGKDMPLFSRGAGIKTIKPIVADAPRGSFLVGTMTRSDDGLAVASMHPFTADTLRFDVREVGYYALEARLMDADGSVLAAATNDYAVTPPIPERPSELGVCFHSSHCARRDAWDISFDLLDTAGFARIRDDLPWSHVERKTGEYKIPESIDRTVALCQEHGIKPLYIFGYPSPAYSDYKKGFPTNDVTRAACAEAMAFAVGHFRGKVTEWELWNEPNQAHPVNDYLPLAKVVYPRVKAVAPEITFITGGGSGAGGGVGGGYIYPVLNAGGREFQDGWSAHPYMAPRNTPDLGYKGGPPLARASLPCCLEANLNWGRARKAGQKPLQFWITEYGWFTNAKGVSGELQAAYTVRAFLIAREYGLDTGLFIYDFMDDGLDPEEREHNYGIIRYDFSPKPAYQAVAVFASLFGNKRTRSCVKPAKDVRVLTCGEEGATVTAVWGVEPTDIEIDWPAPRKNLAMLDWQGRRLPTPAGDKLRCKADKLPIYLVETPFFRKALAADDTRAPQTAVRLHFLDACATAGTGEKKIAVRLVPQFSSTNAVSAATARLEGTLRRDDGLAIASRPSESLDTLVFDVPELGFYTLDAAALAADGATNAAASTTYAVVPEVKERPREFGTCTHFAMGRGEYPLSFELLRIAGVSRVRDDLSWGSIERAPGRYRIPDAIEVLVSRCEEYGIEPLFVFGYANTACYPYGFSRTEAHGTRRFPTNDVTRRACAEALAYAVRHFGARVPAWELWNEPNYADPVKDYLPLLKFVYPAVKSARPEAKLISGGGSGAGGGPGGGFINPVFDAKGQDFQDGWSVHPYMSPNTPDIGYFATKGESDPTSKFVSIGQSIRYLLSRADENRRSDGKALELWVTEYGWTCAEVADDHQAAYLARAMLLYRRHARGVPVYFYDFQNDGTDPGEIEHNFGLIRKDYAPKQSFQAVAVAASLLANRPFTDALLDGDECRVYGYGEGGRADFYAAWNVGKSWKDNEAPDEREVQVALPDGDWKLIDWQGRALPLERAADGRATLKLSILPSYLVRAR